MYCFVGIVEKLDYLERNNIQSILLQSSIFNISDELFELSDRQFGKIQTSDLLKFDPLIGDEEDFDDLMEILANKSKILFFGEIEIHKEYFRYAFNS
jgi:hypothetical protein